MFVWKIVASYIHHITCYRWLVGFPNMTGCDEKIFFGLPWGGQTSRRGQPPGNSERLLKNEAHFWGFSDFFFTEILLFLLFLGAGRTPLSIFDDRWNQCIKNDMPWVVSGRSHRSDLAATWIFFGRSAWEVTSTNMAMRRYPGRFICSGESESAIYMSMYLDLEEYKAVYGDAWCLQTRKQIITIIISISTACSH